MRRAAILAAVFAAVFAAVLPAFSEASAGTLRAGVAEGYLRVPVGAPLGGYLRPPILGDVAFGDDPTGELFDFFPYGVADDGTPLQPVPDELRALHSPYATYFPPSRGYYDSLITKAVALTDGEDWIVLVKNDLIGMLDEVVVAVRERVSAETGVDLGAGLILSGTHTHDGPGALANHSTRYFWFAMDAYQPELFARLVDDIARVVIDAVEKATVPAGFGYATGLEAEGEGGQPRLNSFRRTRDIYTVDRADAQHLLRRRIGVLRIDQVGTDGASVRPLAVVFNYPAHGIAFDVENMFFSGDVLGSAERELEATFDEPVVAMLVQSTGGDVSPRADGGPTLQRIERFGKLLAPQVRAVYDSITALDPSPDLEAVSQRVILDRERLGYEGNEFPYPWGGAQCNAQRELLPEGCLPGTPPDAHDLADNGVGENGSFLPTDTIVGAARIGSAVLLVQPGEPLAEYGLRLLEASPFGYDNTFVWGYSNDHVGYILPDFQEDWLLGGTEGTTTFWGWKQGGRLLDANVALMDALQNDTAPPANEVEAAYVSYPTVRPPAIPSIRPGRSIVEPASIERFETTSFSFEGGDPVLDLPRVVMERRNENGDFEPVRLPNGKLLDRFFEMHLEYALSSAAHQWTVHFEAPKDWPAGEYRFAVTGTAGIGEVLESGYELASASFEVRPSPTLRLSPQFLEAGESLVTLAYTPRPENYRLIDPLVASSVPAPVREGKVTFRGDGGTVIVDDDPVIEERDGRLVAVYGAVLPAGETFEAAGEDRFGNTSM
jgi:hypothetical protein